MSIKSSNSEIIRQFIRQGQLDKATKALQTEVRQHPDLLDTLVVLDGRRQEFQRKRAAGLLDPKEESRQHAQLSTDLLEVIRLLEQREVPTSRRSYFWLIAVALILLAFGGWYRYQQAQSAETRAYQLVLNTNTAPACAEFLEKYPSGKFHEAVRQKLQDLTRQSEQYLQSARAMRRAGELGKAREYAQKALEIQPEQPEVLQFLKDIPK